jgi:acetylornithine/succinyldiaminopimelate/putrescine aminotransferase
MLSARDLFLKNLAQTSDSPLQLEVEKAEGVYLFDTNGKRYFDLISGISVSNIGHCNPVVVNAINSQVSKYMHLMVYGEFIQQPQVALAKRLTDLLPSSLSNVYFVNSGSEAVEGAMKLAKRFTGRSEIISFKNAYHGSTQGSLSIMGNEEFKQSFRPLLPNINHIEFNSFSDLNFITTSTAAVFIEPVQGEAGVRIPAEGFLKSLREKCNETGTLLVFDEIQTGMGRTGHMFAFQKYGVLPDILLLAKALGGGMPLGAFISSKEIMSTLSYNPVLGHITTFGGHPVSCAAALGALSVLSENKIVETVEHKSELFQSLLTKHKAVLEIRRSGLLIAVELGAFEKVLTFIKYALEEGVITDWFLFCNTAVRIAPPLTITNDQIREVCSSLLRVLNRL